MKKWCRERVVIRIIVVPDVQEIRKKKTSVKMIED